jgi:hypothetical protein
MNPGYTNFLAALNGQQQNGVPFSQLAPGHPAPQQQQFSDQDGLSPEEQQLARLRMLQMRDQTAIPTMDPGQSWGGLDANNFHPDDVMSDSMTRYLRQERI